MLCNTTVRFGTQRVFDMIIIIISMVFCGSFKYSHKFFHNLLQEVELIEFRSPLLRVGWTWRFASNEQSRIYWKQ